MPDTDPIRFITDYWYIWIMAAILIFLLYLILRRKGKSEPEFKPQPLYITIDDHLKDKFSISGHDMKNGKVYIGFQRIAKVRKYLNVKGIFNSPEYDAKKREIRMGSAMLEENPYDILWLKCAHNNIIYRIFHFKDYYMALKASEEDGSPCLKMDHESIFLPAGSDMMRFGKVWTNCHDGLQYLTDISMARLNEQAQMVVENWPDLMAHLNATQAMRERAAKRGIELDKEKYKEKESAGDTTITPGMEP